MNMPKITTKHEFEKWVCDRWDEINAYLDHWQTEINVPLTSSIDIRESQTKIAPVDHNTYPAGFNNICQKDLKNAGELFKKYFSRQKNIQTVGLIPESHTKNGYYLDNLHFLKETIQEAGVEVALISPDPGLFNGSDFIELESHSGFKLKIHSVSLIDHELRSSTLSKKFDFLVLNNDQSNPLPIDWTQLKAPVAPSPTMGWYRRSKIDHFTHYKEVAEKFCKHFDIDMNLIHANFRSVDHVDFNTKEGLDRLGQEVESFLKTLPPDSSLFIKASQGTYGMGISVVKSAEEIVNMNRKNRNKMDVGKNNLKFTSVLVQEGVETVVKYDGAPAEITVYLIDGRPTGGFVRFNPERGTQANLNSQGMLYQKYCISEIRQGQDYQCKEATYCIVARLSVIAAGYEMKKSETT
jgi:glutamate--cysteine ligase